MWDHTFTRPPTNAYFFPTIFLGASVFVYNLGRHNGMAKFRALQNFAHANRYHCLAACSLRESSRRRLAFFMCSLDWNIHGTCFGIYAVTGTARNSGIENSFAINRANIASWNSRVSFRSGNPSRRDSLRSYWRSCSTDNFWRVWHKWSWALAPNR